MRFRACTERGPEDSNRNLERIHGEPISLDTKQHEKKRDKTADDTEPKWIAFTRRETIRKSTACVCVRPDVERTSTREVVGQLLIRIVVSVRVRRSCSDPFDHPKRVGTLPRKRRFSPAPSLRFKRRNLCPFSIRQRVYVLRNLWTNSIISRVECIF